VGQYRADASFSLVHTSWLGGEGGNRGQSVVRGIIIIQDIKIQEQRCETIQGYGSQIAVPRSQCQEQYKVIGTDK